MHIWTHLKKESEGKTGLGLEADGMVEHVGKVLVKLVCCGNADESEKERARHGVGNKDHMEWNDKLCFLGFVDVAPLLVYDRGLGWSGTDGLFLGLCDATIGSGRVASRGEP